METAKPLEVYLGSPLRLSIFFIQRANTLNNEVELQQKCISAIGCGVAVFYEDMGHCCRFSESDSIITF